MTCINHKGCLNNMGYGQVRRNGKTLLAHRVAYSEHYGISLSDMKGKVVRHTCDNPKCINPDHLLLGTQRENMQDKLLRGRQAYNESHWLHKLSAADVQWIKANCKPRDKVMGCIPIAKKFGVSHALIKAIMRGEKRTHA